MSISGLIQLGLGSKLDLEKDIRRSNFLLSETGTEGWGHALFYITLTDISMDLPLKYFSS